MKIKFISPQWYLEDTYNIADPLGPLMTLVNRKDAGPQGIARVKVFPDGKKTTPGWGKDNFMRLYHKGRFSGISLERPYAVVMRSVNAICLDIDGKNGGFEGVKSLGNLPPTAAEKSKSGNGLHLFYRTNDRWDSKLGFAAFRDRIGLAQGVDLRATGCVYHFPHQRWNNKTIALLPSHLGELIHKLSVINLVIDSEVGEERDELLIAEVRDSLKDPVPEGKRNMVLFARGARLRKLGYPDWQNDVTNAAERSGLEDEEIHLLLGNIARYT